MSEVHVHGVTHAAERAAIEEPARGPSCTASWPRWSATPRRDTRAADLARRHWQVLEAIAATATVLPVRFGTVMAGDAAVADELLAPDHDALRARLERFEGTVQLTVKGTYDEAALMRSIVEGSPEVARLRERVRALSEAAGHFERIRLGELVAGAVEQARQQDARGCSSTSTPIADRPAGRAGDRHRRRRQRGVPRRARPDRRVRPGAGRRRRGAGRARRAARDRPAPALQLRVRGGGGMGLIGALVKLPLAPLTGTVWIAEQIQAQAEAEYYDEGAIQAQLREIDEARRAGTIDDADADAEEDALMERLLEGRAR
jgi:hypothetical protein